MRPATEPLDLLLPFYGDPKLLFETIDSVLMQSDPAWVLRIVDDAYPDATVRAHVERLEDSRIHYHRNDDQLGANANYARALSLAKSDYITILGADDRLRPTYVARMREIVAAFPDVDVVQPGVAVIDGTGAEVLPRVDGLKRWLRPKGADAVHLTKGERAVTRLMHGNWTYFPSLLWRRELVVAQGLRPFHVVQDLALLVDLLCGGATLAVDSHVTFEYRRHSGSDSSQKTLSGSRFEEEARYHQLIESELLARGWKRAARAARVHWTSRAHALLLSVSAVKGGHSPKGLLRHAFGGILRRP